MPRDVIQAGNINLKTNLINTVLLDHLNVFIMRFHELK